MINRMKSPPVLSESELATWLKHHSEWSVEKGALLRKFSFETYGIALGFVVRLACIAEKHDHHPDMLFTYGSVGVSWATHSAGGITMLDTEMAERSDLVYAG